MLEQILPLLLSLKMQLEKKRSVLLRDLMTYLKVITSTSRRRWSRLFNDNPRLKREIEYDLRQFSEEGKSEAVKGSRAQQHQHAGDTADPTNRSYARHGLANAATENQRVGIMGK